MWLTQGTHGSWKLAIKGKKELTRDEVIWEISRPTEKSRGRIHEENNRTPSLKLIISASVPHRSMQVFPGNFRAP